MNPTNETKQMRIENRDQLIYALTVASELEHGLCLQYLFAAFSLKQELSEGGLTWEQLNQVRRWRAGIFHVAAQEMLHLTQAANLLTAIGGAPHLQRPNFPQAPRYYPTRLPWELARFSHNTLERFILYERPKGVDESTAQDPAVDLNDDPDYEHPTPVAQPESAHHRPSPVLIKSARTIGEIYEAILDGFENISDLFIGEESSQVTGDLVDFPQLVPVTNTESARRAIELIIDQGEGTRRDRSDSHFGTFKGIHAQYAALRQQDTSFSPVRRVLRNPLARAHSDNSYPHYHVLTDEFALQVEKLFTEIYEIMVQALFLVLSRTERSPQALRQLSTFALRLMMTAIVPVGDALTHLPAGAKKYGQQVAGPSFEYFPDVQLLPHPKAAWLLLHERTRQTASRARLLSTRTEAPVQLGWAARNLEELTAMLKRPAH